MIQETVDWLNANHFAQVGEGVEYSADSKDEAVTTHYTFSQRLDRDGSTVTERLSEHSHPIEAECEDCRRIAPFLD